MAEEKNHVNRIPSKGKNFIDRFTPIQQVFLISVIVLTIIGIIFIIKAAIAFNYGVLFSNLTPRDSGMILERLNSMNVSYKIENAGSVIKVPKEKIADLRIELAAVGLPEKGGVGLDMYGKTPFLTADYVQYVNHIHAVENELARSISQLPEVIAAKVFITMPKYSYFIEDQEPAKASIILKMRPAAQFSRNTIAAILHLTTHSVDGLKPGNIAILDVNGNIISEPADDQDVTFDNSRFTYQKDLENSFSRKIVNLLEPIVGIGKVRANVKLTLDFDKVETTEETVDPNSTAKLSEKFEVSSFDTTDKSKSENSEASYEVSKKVTHVTKPMGEIKKISAAIIVDDGVKVEMVDGQLQKEIIKRSPEELQTLTRLVQLAIGYNAERGDIVELANLSFDTSAVTESDFLLAREKNKELINELIKYSIYVLLFLLLFFLILRPVFRKVIEIFKNAERSQVDIRRLDQEMAAQHIMDQTMDEASKSSKKSSNIRDKVVDFAEKNVDETASLVRSLLVED